MSGTSADEFRDSFFEECEELLEAMQDGFDQLAEDMAETETMHSIFRAVHSIKGGAGAFRLDSLVGFAHNFETALDKVRSGQIDITEPLLELLRQCGDHLSDLVEASREDNTPSLENTDELQDSLSKEFNLAPAGEEEELPDFTPTVLDIGIDVDLPDVAEEDSISVYNLRFKPDRELFRSGNEPLLLFRALEEHGEVDVTADVSQIKAFDDLDCNDCDISWSLTLKTSADVSDIREVFDFVDGLCDLDIEGDEQSYAQKLVTALVRRRFELA